MLERYTSSCGALGKLPTFVPCSAMLDEKNWNWRSFVKGSETDKRSVCVRPTLHIDRLVPEVSISTKAWKVCSCYSSIADPFQKSESLPLPRIKLLPIKNQIFAALTTPGLAEALVSAPFWLRRPSRESCNEMWENITQKSVKKNTSKSVMGSGDLGLLKFHFSILMNWILHLQSGSRMKLSISLNQHFKS